jgi:ABC-type phosphate transport system substrate-binding protein
MKTNFLGVSLACVVLLVGALGAAPIEGSVVIVNQDVPVGSVSAAALKDIYTGKTTYWPGGQSVVIAVLGGDNDAALKEVSGMDASQFKTFWQRLVFSGRGQLPRKANDAGSLVALVASTQGAIALVPANAGLGGVKILEVK